MTFEHASGSKVVLIIISAAVIMIGGLWLAWMSFPEKVTECTAEAMICPDGSAVGRTGPDCEFAPCPEGDIYKEWKTMNDERNGLSFKYPERLDTKYIEALDWPPAVTVSGGPLPCVEAGSETSRAGRTERRIIGSKEFCMTKIVEGAAGSIYTQYAYATSIGDGTVIFTFSTRATQCGNYDEPTKSECDDERSSFDIDTLVGRVVGSVEVLREEAVAESGIMGSAMMGPTCPVMKDPPDPRCADRPFKGDFIVWDKNGKKIKEFSSGADGTFKVDLSEGDYSVRMAAIANILPHCGEQNVSVKKGVFTKIDISCDSGIR